ncbi:hypothetical protein BPNPMPFG_000300 [Mesorhizobium sp. AR07]|uniref:hypothetical protein n=1 Tax=Mesorhizobium sp. AR07 TaxID=2865838 RepID=UPI00215F37FA|nr:hypothetical protein [Mesorhizobium sp. AR07]UVK44835.1 hypothetical protein BPNPMPFG_000300 [Mesorhizobium sp. AR07]
MFAKLKKTDTYKIPSPSDVPEVAAMEVRRAELDARRAALDVERNSLWAVAQDGTDDGDDAVAAMLGDAPDAANPSKQKARARLVELAKETATITKALDVLGGRMAAARNAASTAVVAQVKPEYARRVQALASALAEAAKAAVSFRALCDSLNDASVSWLSLTPLQPNRVLGDPRDRHGVLAQWFREAEQAGYISKSDFPEGLK